MTIMLPDDLLHELAAIAQAEQRTPAEVLQTMLRQYPRQDAETPPPGSLAAMAASARRAGLVSEKPVDTAERSREILKSEYADYLKRRLDQDDHANTNG